MNLSRVSNQTIYVTLGDVKSEKILRFLIKLLQFDRQLNLLYHMSTAVRNVVTAIPVFNRKH
jgi:hypothetical protein